MSFDNLVLNSDSYKFSHHKQYPAGTTSVYSYLESRGGKFTETVFFGLQYILKRYLSKPITQQDIDDAEEVIAAHFGSKDVFNREGWEYILNTHGGKLPIRIKAVAEGTVVNTKNVLMTIENTDAKCFWFTNYLETLLLQVWYPITVATQSREMKKIILKSLEKTGDAAGIPFKLHDFGFRGVSSVETAGIGGAAHLVNFMGTDTLPGLLVCKKYYSEAIAGFSIPAAEHSTITSWGRSHEKDAYENMLDQFPTGLVAVVSDSYNIYNACEHIWGEELKDKILNRNGTLVVRPDSGEPDVVVTKVLNALGKAFGYTINSKKYKVLPPQIRVIQGDGVDLDSLKKILYTMESNQWSADNVAFGSGGALLQKMNRDTNKFAIKCSSITVSGVEQDVFKDPVDDKGKTSKKGRLKLIFDGPCTPLGGGYKTVRESEPGVDLLQTVYLDGELVLDQTLAEIRAKAAL